MRQRWTGRLGFVFTVATLVVCSQMAQAGSSTTGGPPPQSSNHTTDGVFGTGEWTGPNAGPGILTKSFDQIQIPGGPLVGGATLYVGQGQGTQFGNLYLAYDYWGSPALGLNLSTAFFDVFFEVPSDHNDYLVRMFATAGNDLYLEKPLGSASTLVGDGSFNVNDPIWSPLSDADKALGDFHAALAFGTSPGHDTNHLIAEFQLTINQPGVQGGPNKGQGSAGIYDPSPAFWSASAAGPGVDPPISSEVFQLNPLGGTSLLGGSGVGGMPVLTHDQIVTPEPMTFVGAILGALVVAGLARRPKV